MTRLLDTIACPSKMTVRSLLLSLLIACLLASTAFATDPPGEPTTELQPMDETDELPEPPVEPTGLQPMDETDELADPTDGWHEVAGYGLVEIVPTTSGATVRQHPWCPWNEGALSTSPCARQLRIVASRRVAMRPASSSGPEIVSLQLSSAGLLVVDPAERSATRVTLLDAAGHRLAELRAGESAWLEAGSSYLRIERWPGAAALALDFAID